MGGFKFLGQSNIQVKMHRSFPNEWNLKILLCPGHGGLTASARM